MERFWSKVVIGAPDACWEWAGARADNGYGRFRGDRSQYAQRTSWILANGPIPNGLFVCHACDNRACVNPAHLFLGTHQDNLADMVAKGRSLRGERHNKAELTETDVLAIRTLWAVGGMTQQQIANRFGTNKANVSQIVRGKKWKHLLPDDWQPPARGRWSRAA